MNGYFQVGISHVRLVFCNQPPSLHINQKGKKKEKGGGVAKTVLSLVCFTSNSQKVVKLC